MSLQSQVIDEIQAESINQSKTEWPNAAKWVARQLGKHPLGVLLVLLGEGGHTIFSVLVALTLGKLVDYVGGGGSNLSTIQSFAFIIATYTVLRFIAGIVFTLAGKYISERVQFDARGEAFHALLKRDPLEITTQKSGDMMARLTGDSQMLSVMILPGLTMLLSSALSTLIPMFGIVVLSPQLLIVPFTMAIISFMLVLRYSASLDPITWRVRGSFGQMSSAATEAIAGLSVVRSHRLHQKMIMRFNAATEDYANAELSQAKVEALYLPTLVYAVGLGIALFHGLWLYDHGIVTAGALVGFITLYLQFQSPISTPLYGLSLVQLGLSSARRLIEVIYAPQRSYATGHYEAKVFGTIDVQNMSLNLPSGHHLFENLTLSIRPGEIVALIGETGAGKSTLLEILAGLREPTSGTVLLDGVPLQRWQLSSLRDNIAILEQEVFLFNQTVAANVQVGRKEKLTDDQIRQLLHFAKATEFISTLRDGIHTHVGINGNRFSGGQRQRIGLARALASKPRVLLLDDVTSALDESTGRSVIRELKNFQPACAVVFSTNRWAELSEVDRILLLRNGKIVEYNDIQEFLLNHQSDKNLLGGFNHEHSIR